MTQKTHFSSYKPCRLVFLRTTYSTLINQVIEWYSIKSHIYNWIYRKVKYYILKLRQILIVQTFWRMFYLFMMAIARLDGFLRPPVSHRLLIASMSVLVVEEMWDTLPSEMALGTLIARVMSKVLDVQMITYGLSTMHIWSTGKVSSYRYLSQWRICH